MKKRERKKIITKKMMMMMMKKKKRRRRRRRRRRREIKGMKCTLFLIGEHEEYGGVPLMETVAAGLVAKWRSSELVPRHRERLKKISWIRENLNEY